MRPTTRPASTIECFSEDLVDLEGEFRSFVARQEFPCVGAKSALARDGMTFMLGRDIRSAWDDLAIHRELSTFARNFSSSPSVFRSFVVLFEEPGVLSEETFENALWERLQSLSDKDSWLGETYDPRVSADPKDAHFAMSFGGEAFFVVGLHPGASRPGRRLRTPALVFNPHHQFELLRADNRYERLRNTIIERDVRVAGCANPMLAQHGERSAAPQYSGRRVSSGWECPFVRKGLNDPEQDPDLLGAQKAEPDQASLRSWDTRRQPLG